MAIAVILIPLIIVIGICSAFYRAGLLAGELRGNNRVHQEALEMKKASIKDVEKLLKKFSDLEFLAKVLAEANTQMYNNGYTAGQGSFAVNNITKNVQNIMMSDN